jgi:hypothetical protein
VSSERVGSEKHSMSRALTMRQTMSVTGVQVWGWTSRQVLLARDWWHLREVTIQVAPVRVVARLDGEAVRTEIGTEDNVQKASRQQQELTAMSA